MGTNTKFYINLGILYNIMAHTHKYFSLCVVNAVVELFLPSLSPP